jgi:hypothetical protein
MAATSTTSPAITLTLTEEERTHLLTILEQALREKKIEVHRTKAFAARELVQEQASFLEKLIDSLRQA